MLGFLANLWLLVRPYKTRLLLGVFFGVVAGLTSPLLMIAVKLAINLLFPSSDGTSLAKELSSAPAWIRDFAVQAEASLPKGSGSPAALLAIGSIPLVMLLRGAASYLNLYCLHWASLRGINDLRTRLFGHIEGLSLDFLNRNSTGELISRIYNDTLQLHGTLTGPIGTIIAAPISILSLAVWLLSQEPRLTLLSLTILPLCVVPISIYGRKLRRASEGLQTEAAGLTNLIHEAFSSIRVVKAYNLEETVLRRFTEAGRRFSDHGMRAIRSLELPGPMIEFCGAVGVALIFVSIAMRPGSGMKAGDFFSFIGALFLLYQPIKQLSRVHGELQRAKAASDRVFEILTLRPTVADPVAPKRLHSAGADIVFDQVTFRYADKVALDNFDLTIRAGQVVALVGQSGSGKTTVTNLLLRFIDPAEGMVSIGGIDLRDVSQRELRSQMAIVTQDVVLFNDTIRQNIAYGRPGATAAEIEQAAKMAHAHEFILEKPQGYETVVGEKGVTLSGGQRQRIAIARAILRDAPILVLDEATSALDNEKERAVQAAFDELMKGRTTLVIAHRLSTIQNADLIVVMDQGRIVETGTHAELIGRGGVYQKLYSIEFTK
jgi:subfamily B ATP-binding cassette protein MsbA